MTDGAHLRERVDTSWHDLWELVDSMGAEGLAITGPDGWAVKDHLAHVGAWEQSLLAIFDGRDRIQAMGLAEVERDTDAINLAVWTLHRDRSSEDAVAYFRDSHAQLMAKLNSLDDADLDLPYAHYQPTAKGEENSDLPVVEWVAGNTYEHYLEHIDWIKNLISKRI
jgi:hypothetical protein